MLLTTYNGRLQDELKEQQFKKQKQICKHKLFSQQQLICK